LVPLDGPAGVLETATETVVGASCGRVEVEEGVEDALGVLTPG
jgi:hypothetical protein